LGFGISTPTPAQQPVPTKQPVPAYPSAYPALPHVTPYDAKSYAWLYTGAAWQLLPRNEARVLDRPPGQRGKQLTGTLTIDGCYAVPAVPADSRQGVLLLFRKEGDFTTCPGIPPGETGVEVVKLQVTPGPRKGQLIRTARLHRLGEAAATFGEKREPISVQKITRSDGVYHAVRLSRPLAPGRYALYLPDRAFEFEVR